MIPTRQLTAKRLKGPFLFTNSYNTAPIKVSIAIPMIPTNVCNPVMYPLFYFVENSLTRYKLAVKSPDIPMPKIDKAEYVMKPFISFEKFIKELPINAKINIAQITFLLLT